MDYFILEALQGLCGKEMDEYIKKTLRKRRRELLIYKLRWSVYLFFLKIKGLIINTKWKIWLMLTRSI